MDKPAHNSEPLAHQPSRPRPAHAQPHSPDRSKILMRQAVKRPGPSLKRQIRAMGELVPASQGRISEIVGPHQPEPRRPRTSQVPKSRLISHFSDIKPGPAYVSPLPPAAASPPANPATPAQSFQPPPPPEPRRPLTSTEVLEHGLRQARAHEQKPLKRSHAHLKRQLSVVAIVTLAVGVLTVLAAQNLSGAQLQVASAKAGFSAKLPNYKPAGFSQSGLNSSKGEVAAQFQSDSDGRNYTVTQKVTNWDSTALRNNYVAPTDPNYETVAVNGQTVYIYGNHNATWINAGVWYNVVANGALSDHQLVELATSL